jgi:predicted ATPase
MSAPYISSVALNPNVRLNTKKFPGSLRFVPDLHLKLDTAVTFFVGENGSGKSTLLEAIAVKSGFPISGGGTNEIGESHGLNEKSQLAKLLRVSFSKRPLDGYFFRAELHAHFASLLDERKEDPDFGGDPYMRYGGKPLHTKSHGEAFLSVMMNRFTDGLFFLDEPESALSPRRQLTLLGIMYDLARKGNTQFIIATHSAILLTYPDARIVSFDDSPLTTVPLSETVHYQITRGILQNPESYWKHLRNPDSEQPDVE